LVFNLNVVPSSVMRTDKVPFALLPLTLIAALLSLTARVSLVDAFPAPLNSIAELPKFNSSWQPAQLVAGRRRDDWLQINAVPSQGRPLTLWATFYHIHQAQSISGGQPLLDLEGNQLGPSLSDHDWCYAALQGTVLVNNGRGQTTTYNFAGRGDRPQIDCSPFFSSLSWEAIAKVNRARFTLAKAPYGYGTAGFNLVPYRTIAVDKTRIPIGSVLYIPEARGRVITLPSGQRVTHDGYFFAADVGSAIRGSHIDVFVGTAERNPFPFITSHSNGTFQAFLVQDSAVSQALWTLHRSQ
jgi:3D (Asp-Asp-Asp) domain-containing protein